MEGLFRPHYMTWSEQQRIEFHAPPYLRIIIRIVTATGLRIYKELAPIRKDQVDPENTVVWIPDSKTPSGIADVPLTEVAVQAFGDQITNSGPGPSLFPSEKDPESHRASFKKCWCTALRKAVVPYFPDLRSALDLRRAARCGRCGGQMGDAVASARRCPSFQAVLPDEAADEAGGARQA